MKTLMQEIRPNGHSYKKPRVWEHGPFANPPLETSQELDTHPVQPVNPIDSTSHSDPALRQPSSSENPSHPKTDSDLVNPKS